MKAMVIVKEKDGGKMELQDAPIPKPKPDELLIKVKAAALNRADLFRVQGAYPVATASGMPEIVGGEASGIVTDTGNDVTGFAVGDRVMGMCVGGYAEFATMNCKLAIPVPDKMSWEEAAAVPISFMTEYDAVVTHGRLKKGESVLVSGASSGVGVAAVQIARLWGAKPLICMSGSPAKLAALEKLGMDVGINYKTERFKDAVLAATDDKGVDLIIDHVGGPDLKDNLKCMAIKGRLVSVGRLGGIMGELNMDLLALKRLSIIGVTFRTRKMAERIDIARRMTADLLPALAEGRLKPVIDRTFPLEKAAEAHQYMSSDVQFGKIVLTL
ncbi:MAG: NAD(P)H-quinone oxidoreductase [Deltaproteobacteria bacterium]|nr:NAD(P)H-quinone oxidoreductase [Deltaproteobacteria bacterium]